MSLACGEKNEECADHSRGDNLEPLLPYQSETIHQSDSRRHEKETEILKKEVANAFNRLGPYKSIAQSGRQ